MSHRLRHKPIHVSPWWVAVLLALILTLAYLCGTLSGEYIGRAAVTGEILDVLASNKDGRVGVLFFTRYKNHYKVEPKLHYGEGFDTRKGGK